MDWSPHGAHQFTLNFTVKMHQTSPACQAQRLRIVCDRRWALHTHRYGFLKQMRFARRWNSVRLPRKPMHKFEIKIHGNKFSKQPYCNAISNLTVLDAPNRSSLSVRPSSSLESKVSGGSRFSRARYDALVRTFLQVIASHSISLLCFFLLPR